MVWLRLQSVLVRFMSETTCDCHVFSASDETVSGTVSDESCSEDSYVHSAVAKECRMGPAWEVRVSGLQHIP